MSNPDAPPASISYVVKDGDGISVAGRIPRKESHGMLIPLPSDIKRQLEDLLEGGSMSGAIVGLVKYALDDLQTNGKRIVIQLPAK